MQGEGDVGLWKAREQAIRQHGPGARHDLFRRLGDEHQRATPVLFQAQQRLRRSDPARHVDVVTAAMGDEHLPPVPVGLVAARIIETGLFLHRQAIEFGAHHDGGAVAVLVDRNQPGLADILGDLEAERAHLGGEPGGRFHLLKRKFRMGVEFLVKRIELRIVARERRLDRLFEIDNVELCMGRQQAGRNQCGGRRQGFGKWIHGVVLLECVAVLSA
jgi:hypothetical protein